LNPTVARECQLSCNPFCKGNPPPTQPPKTQPPVTQPPATQTPDAGTHKPNPTDYVTPSPKPNGKFLGKGKLCKDYHNECANWARQGECEANPGWMLRNCLISCKVKSCDMGVQKPSGQCANPLGLSYDGSGSFQIPDSAFSSPAHLAPGGGWRANAANARLYFEDDYDQKRIGAWCAASHDSAKSDSQGYIQVDLGQQKNHHIYCYSRS